MDGSVLFSVRSGAEGVPGTVVATENGNGLEGANIYKSLRDGTNKPFLSGAAIGLEQFSGSIVDGIALLPNGSILFTEDFGAVGVNGCAVDAAASTRELETNVYSSSGDGTNDLMIPAGDLGLEAGDDASKIPKCNIDALSLP